MNFKEYTANKKPPVVEELEAVDEFYIQESGSFKLGPVLPSDPPAMLVMRRTSIRMFPNGQRVALYFVDKINKYISVPYTPMQWNQHMGSAHVGEEVEVVEMNIIEHMKDIVENKSPKVIMFEDGKTKKVDVLTASTILNMYTSLNTENRNMILDMGQKNKQLFEQVVDFAWTHKK